MVGDVRRFPLHEAARLRRKAKERGPSGLKWWHRVLRLAIECRRSARDRSRRRDAGINSEEADLHPERCRVAA